MKNVTINKDGVKVEMSDGEGSQGYTLLSYEGLSIYDADDNRKAWFGQDDSSYIEKLYTDDIECKTIVKNGVNRPVTFYVNANPPSGSDQSGTSVANACSSISELLSDIAEKYGKYSNWKNLTIEVASGSYYEDINITGWIGAGQITINLNPSAIVYGQWKIYDNTMMVIIKGGRTSGNETNDGARLYINDSDSSFMFYVRNCHCTINGIRAMNKSCPSGNTRYNAYFAQGECGNIYITNCDISRFQHVLLCNKNSLGCMVDSRGYTESAGKSRYGSRIGMNNYPVGKNASSSDNGGELSKSGDELKSLFDPNYESSTTPETPPITPPTTVPTVFTKSFTITNLKTTPEGSGSSTSGRSGQIGQGKWGKYKPHRGWGDVPSSLATFCSGATNISITLTMTRLNTSHGYSGSVPSPKIVHNSGTWSSGVTFARGGTKTITLPSTIVSQLSSGSLNKLQLWAGTSTNDYSFYNNVKLSVTCTKNV